MMYRDILKKYTTKEYREKQRCDRKQAYKGGSYVVIWFWKLKQKMDKKDLQIHNDGKFMESHYETMREQNELIEALKAQLLSEKDKCKWFYEYERENYDDDKYLRRDFEEAWQLWISSMPEDIEKRKKRR